MILDAISNILLHEITESGFFTIGQGRTFDNQSHRMNNLGFLSVIFFPIWRQYTRLNAER